MSWSFTISGNIQEYDLTEELIGLMATQHLEYPNDMIQALNLAKQLNLRSATCTGFRTPNPAGGPEVIEVAVRGFADAVDFNDMIRRAILTGPDDGERAQEAG